MEFLKDNKAMLCFIGISITAVVGWLLNIAKLFSAETAGEVAGRTVAVFIAPLGAIAGYF